MFENLFLVKLILMMLFGKYGVVFKFRLEQFVNSFCLSLWYLYWVMDEQFFLFFVLMIKIKIIMVKYYLIVNIFENDRN